MKNRNLPCLALLAVLFRIPVTGASMQPDTLWNQTDSQGLKQGYWKKLTPEGGLIYKGFFIEDRPVGKMERFYENGNKQADLYFIKGTGEAYATIYYQNGQVAAAGKYMEMQKDSVWSYFSYYTSSLSYLETYREGRKHGKSMKFYPEGSVSEILNWEDDLKHGKWQQFYEDSTLRLSSSYLRGELHGEYRVWGRDSIPLIQGTYVMGKMDGDWSFYDNSGHLANRLEYENGKIMNKEAMEEWVKKYMDEIESKLGKIPEVEFENFFDRK